MAAERGCGNIDPDPLLLTVVAVEQAAGRGGASCIGDMKGPAPPVAVEEDFTTGAEKL